MLPDSKVHGADMGPIWALSAPDGPHVGLMNFAIWAILTDAKGPCRCFCGSCLQVLLPHGTLVKITASYADFINVVVYPSAADWENTKGREHAA